MDPKISTRDLISRLCYSGELSRKTNKQLLQECFDEVYGSVKLDRPGLVIEEMMDRINNEDDVMKKELKAGILPKGQENE